jgi:hypothetical protein
MKTFCWYIPKELQWEKKEKKLIITNFLNWKSLELKIFKINDILGMQNNKYYLKEIHSFWKYRNSSKIISMMTLFLCLYGYLFPSLLS